MPDIEKNRRTHIVKLLYLIHQRGSVSITALIKLCYLIDLVAVKNNNGQQIFDYSYVRYNFGPFDKRIYEDIQVLIEEEKISVVSTLTGSGDEHLVYEFNQNNSDTDWKELDQNKKKLIDGVLDKVSGMSAKLLTDLSYKTKPMQEIGATLGGNEDMGKKLNLG